MPYQITEKRRHEYRLISQASRLAKQRALRGEGPQPIHAINRPRLDVEALIPQRALLGLRALSLFSGGGGFDLGFERAGFEHAASHDILEICAKTLKTNRPNWSVHGGPNGDVTRVDWSRFAGQIDVLHGGPPCQPFSIAGKQKGSRDSRDMWPEFVRAVRTIRPRCFVAENVPGILDNKFAHYLKTTVFEPLRDYSIESFKLRAASFGIPQTRTRVFFVGFRSRKSAMAFQQPSPTHRFDHLLSSQRILFARTKVANCMGVRDALGLPDIGVDGIAPTLRSGFTGPRFSTSVLNSKASVTIWEGLGVWPNGVARDRERARLFVPQNGHFRLSVDDCALLQGFPPSWKFQGAVYQILGQIGNAVVPPVAYKIAESVASALIQS